MSTKFAGSSLTVDAQREADKFIYEKETLLPSDYPVNVGYAYVIVSKHGEVRVATCNKTGTALAMLADINDGKRSVDWEWVEIRRCELTARILDKSY